MPTRAPAPRCVRIVGPGKVCNHPRNLHGREAGPCGAMGCRCERWAAPTQPAPVMFSDRP